MSEKFQEQVSAEKRETRQCEFSKMKAAEAESKLRREYDNLLAQKKLQSDLMSDEGVLYIESRAEVEELIEHNDDLTKSLEQSKSKGANLLVQVNKQNETVDDFFERLSLESELVANLRDELSTYRSQTNFGNQAHVNHDTMYVEPGVERGSPSGQERLGVENSTTTIQTREVHTPNARDPSETTSGWKVIDLSLIHI